MQLELCQTERLLRKSEVAKKLGLSVRSIDRKIAEGLFPKGFRIGAAVRWRESVVDQWIADGCPRITF